MTRRPAFSELRWPEDPTDADLPIEWAKSVATQVLDWTWRAFDKLRVNHLACVDLTQPLEQLERDLVRNHFIEIQNIFSKETDGYHTFVPHHEWPETESRASAPAKPPAYDLAFVSLNNRRWAWPLEAKVVQSPGKLGKYLKEVNDKFVGCIAAPLVGEGAMIGYLIQGQAITAFKNLASQLGQTLDELPRFSDRPHRVSHHSRDAAPKLRLHHMLMQCVESVGRADSISKLAAG